MLQRDAENSPGLQSAIDKAAEVKGKSAHGQQLAADFLKKGLVRRQALDQQAGHHEPVAPLPLQQVHDHKLGRVVTQVTPEPELDEGGLRCLLLKTDVFNRGLKAPEQPQGQVSTHTWRMPWKEGLKIATFNNKFWVSDEGIQRMVAGDNFISQDASERVAQMPVFMSDAVLAQTAAVQSWMASTSRRRGALEIKGAPAPDGISFPLELVRTPAPGTDTGTALNFLLKADHSEEDLALLAIGSPHGTLAYQMALRFGLPSARLQVTEAEKGNPVFTLLK